MSKVAVLRKTKPTKCRYPSCHAWAKRGSVLCSSHLGFWARSKKHK